MKTRFVNTTWVRSYGDSLAAWEPGNEDEFPRVLSVIFTQKAKNDIKNIVEKLLKL